MSYLVMECHPGYAVLLDEEGRFLKAANLRYETGQTVYDPVLMKEMPERQRHTVRWISSGIAAIAACFLLFFGIGYYQNYIQPYSSIYLTINPEVQMDLNRQGTVVGLTGANEDGETLLEGYDGKGKDKITVADELIDRAIEMGFLSEGGRVSFSIDSPDEALFQEYGTELRTTIKTGRDRKARKTVHLRLPLSRALLSRSQPRLPRPSRLTPWLCLRPLLTPPIMMIPITAQIAMASPTIHRLPPVCRLRIRTMAPAGMESPIIRTGTPIMIRITTMMTTTATAAMMTMIRMMIQTMTTIRTMTTEFFKKFFHLTPVLKTRFRNL